MTWRLILIICSTLASSPIMAQEPSGPFRVPPARSGDIAIQEELDLARRAGTVAAYDLFLARHPNHPLARVARRERDRLAQEKRR
jgi:hypothetical protein